MAGLGGPWGRMKRKKTRHIEITVLMAMRRVICRLAMSAEERGDCRQVTVSTGPEAASFG